MQLKANNPAIILIVIVLIGGVILFVQSQKVGQNNSTNSGNSIVSESDETKFLEKRMKYKLAPELSGISGYINASEGFRLSDVKGKIILVDFWTYSCINCIRTLPYITAWDEKYKDKGLVIVGVHTPEFEFEKSIENVRKAVSSHNIKYAVVLDNDYSTWRSYENHYWPHKYLIDADGFIRYDHIGEGSYEETEKQIQLLLKERDEAIALTNQTVSVEQNTSFNEIGSPEIYLGYSFARAELGSIEGFQPEKEVNYSLPSFVPKNLVCLQGVWKNNPDNVQLVSDSGKIVLKFQAKQANIVAGGKAELTIKVGNTIQKIQTDAHTLYTVVSGPDYSEKTVEIEVKGKGFQLYTFTFG